MQIECIVQKVNIMEKDNVLQLLMRDRGNTAMLIGIIDLCIAMVYANKKIQVTDVSQQLGNEVER